VIVNNVVVVPFNGYIEQLPFEGGEFILKLIKPILLRRPTVYWFREIRKKH
jgi:hypothetical protein